MTLGASLIARIALEHPERPVREVLAGLVAQQKTIAGVARALGEARPSVRAALDAFGLYSAAPVKSEAHAEATRAGMSAKREGATNALAASLCENSAKPIVGHCGASWAMCRVCHRRIPVVRGIIDDRTPLFAEHDRSSVRCAAPATEAVGAPLDVSALGARKTVTATAQGETRDVHLCDPCAAQKPGADGRIHLCQVCQERVREMLEQPWAFRPDVQAGKQAAASAPPREERRVRVKRGA